MTYRTKQVLRGLAVTASLMLMAVGVAYVVADPERHVLDGAARRAAPGAFVQLSDGVTHYELGGPADGRTVVLAAGSSVPYYIWDPTFAALTRAGFRVLRYDYFGRGWSDRPEVTYSQDLYVRQLTELLDSLHIAGPVDLAGLSFGGSVITSFAARHPDRVRSLVYVDPGFREPEALPIPLRIPLVADVLLAFDERNWAEGQLDDFLHPERFPDWPARYRAQLGFRGFRRALHADATTNAAMDQSAELAAVGRHPRPVLAVWGKQDSVVPFTESEKLLQAMPRARLVAVDSSGHLPIWEQPDVAQPAIVEFLRAVGDRPTEDEPSLSAGPS